MAIWQFTIGLVPRSWAEDEGSLPAMPYNADGYTDMSAAWRHEQLDVDIDDSMSRVLPAAASWSDEIRIWGDEAPSDIQVCYEGTAVESVQVRIAKSGQRTVCTRPQPNSVHSRELCRIFPTFLAHLRVK